ncbi:hypothetical protein [Actinoplanes solisilvae]|nr:hypothetical protein [Actinoplanes solisilvae]
MTAQPSADENVRPCDFCGHPVPIEPIDELARPVRGRPDVTVAS